MKRLFYPLSILLSVYILYVLYEVFMVVPNERIMGPVQRIFYFHVGCAAASYFSVAVVLISSLLYLKTRRESFDVYCEAAAEVGFLLCTIVLVSGMIWAHSAWNTWFRWEPRLVTFLLLWLIFMSFNILRAFGDPVRLASHNAILGIIGAVMVPVVALSVRLLPGLAQLHPALAKGSLDPQMRQVFFLAMLGMVLFQFLLVYLRARVAFIERNTLKFRR